MRRFVMELEGRIKVETARLHKPRIPNFRILDSVFWTQSDALFSNSELCRGPQLAGSVSFSIPIPHQNGVTQPIPPIHVGAGQQSNGPAFTVGAGQPFIVGMEEAMMREAERRSFQVISSFSPPSDPPTLDTDS